MFHTIKKISLLTTSIVAAFVIFMGIMIVQGAWTEPTQTPPLGNIAAPINVSNIGQVKGGGIGLNWAGEAIVGLQIFGGVDRGKLIIGGIPGQPVPLTEKKFQLIQSNVQDGFVLTADASGGGTWQQPANSGGACYIKYSGNNSNPTCGTGFTLIDDLGTWGYCELTVSALSGIATSFRPPIFGISTGPSWGYDVGCPEPYPPGGTPQAQHAWISHNVGKAVLCCKQ